MKARARMLTAREDGMTLIELLVVVLIIGIIAAVAIPSFLGQRDRAYGAEAKTAARNAFIAAQTYYTERQTFAGLTRDALVSIEPSLATAPWSPVWCGAGNNGLYATDTVLCVAMRSRGSSPVEFEMRRDDSYGPGFTRLCSDSTKSGCRPGGVFGWGTW